MRPHVSIVIPAFNQADYLRDSVGSALGQTYEDIEVIVVDDASPDNSADLIREFDDRRLTYVVHRENRMLAAARNTGCKCASGDIVAFLDADDYFLPEKIEAHVAFLGKHPDVGVSYNGRFELNHSSETIRDLCRAPSTCDLADLVMGFPFAPSDMVVRRSWLDRVGLFDERLIHFSEDLDINCRLAMEGCKFGGIDRALNCRRYHSGRRPQVAQRSSAAVEVLERVFSDPRCPLAVRELRRKALAAHALVWSFYALAQEDTREGQRLVRAAYDWDPSYFEGLPTRVMDELLEFTILDRNVDHVELLTRILNQVPSELSSAFRDRNSALAQGYLRRAIRTTLWGAPEEAIALFDEAANLQASVDQRLQDLITWQLLGLEHECGQARAGVALGALCQQLDRTMGPRSARMLRSRYSVNKAFRSYRNARYQDVLPAVWTAFVNHPPSVVNRGVLAVSVRSTIPPLRSAKGTIDG